MKVSWIFILFLFAGRSFAQGYTPRIETCPCMIKVDTALVSRCGYLVVPENRQKPSGRVVKIPFIFARKPDADPTKNIMLYTTGGPGYSTIGNMSSLSYQSGYLQFGGVIFFNQRGTKNSLPCLDCPDVVSAIKRSYSENLNKDSFVLASVKRCRQKLAGEGIDLSAYNTIESAADINDLRKALKFDSLNLMGISYSGGLMLTVARNHPEAVKSLILNSPLPGYVNYEEHALFNHNEALNQVFDNCEADSTNKSLYGNLRNEFRRYFTSITGKTFTIPYLGKGHSDTLYIRYSKQELMDAVIDRMNNAQLKTVPFVITELIKGNHAPYIREILDGVFSGTGSLSHGMRYSIYCSEQIAYSDKSLVKKQEDLMPWFAGYSFNNVDHAICDCWKVKPEPAIVKTPVYSNVPVLVLDGDADPWCRPYYNTIIKRHMPNTQSLIIHNQAHGVSMMVDGVDYLQLFLHNPYSRIVSRSKNVRVEN